MDLLNFITALHPRTRSPSETNHSFLALVPPSFTMPSHPTALPATSSTLPYPWLLASRASPAAFMSETAWALACSPDAVQACEPVTAPMAAYEQIC